VGYTWEWNVIWDNLDVFALGALMTLAITGISLGIGLIVGLFLGLGRMSSIKWVSIPSGAIVEIFRDTPLLIQLFWIFYCLPILTGIKLGVLESAILAMSIHASAYLAEVYRAGIQSIEKGQMEAARSVGMSYWQSMRRIILPQSIRRMVPPFLNVTADFMKASSLTSVVGVYELLRRTNLLISNTWRPLESYTTAAIVYFLIIFPIVWFTGRVERRLTYQPATV